MKNKDPDSRFADFKVSEFNASQLGLVSWLLAAPHGRKRFVMDSYRGLSYCETLEPDENGRVHLEALPAERSARTDALRAVLGGRLSFDIDQLVVRNILLALDWSYVSAHGTDVGPFGTALAELDFGRQPDPYTRFWFLSSGDAVRTWWDDVGEPRYRFLMEKLAAKAAAVRRTAVFGKPVLVHTEVPAALRSALPSRYVVDLPRQKPLRPMAAAVVVRETPTRLYVEDVVDIYEGSAEKVVGGADGAGFWIDRSLLIADRVAPDAVQRFRALDAKLVADITEMNLAAMEKLAPVIKAADEAGLAIRRAHAVELAALVGGDRAVA